MLLFGKFKAHIEIHFPVHDHLPQLTVKNADKVSIEFHPNGAISVEKFTWKIAENLEKNERCQQLKKFWMEAEGYGHQTIQLLENPKISILTHGSLVKVPCCYAYWEGLRDGNRITGKVQVQEWDIRQQEGDFVITMEPLNSEDNSPANALRQSSEKTFIVPSDRLEKKKSSKNE